MTTTSLFGPLDDVDDFERAFGDLVAEAGNLETFCFDQLEKPCDDLHASPYSTKPGDCK